MNGYYLDFNVLWYNNIGSAVCWTMFLNIFTPHLSNLFMMLYIKGAQWRDRCKRKKLFFLKKLDFTNNIKRTKQVLQEDYENLYIGPTFWIEYHYAMVCFTNQL